MKEIQLVFILDGCENRFIKKVFRKQARRLNHLIIISVKQMTSQALKIFLKNEVFDVVGSLERVILY